MSWQYKKNYIVGDKHIVPRLFEETPELTTFSLYIPT